MFPFASRLRWHLAGRYVHLAAGFEAHGRADALVHERVESLLRWNRVRTVLLVLLSLGAITAAASSILQFLPEAHAVLQTVVAAAGAIAGLLGLTAVLVTRYLSQLEADLLLLGIFQSKRKPRANTHKTA